MSIPTKTIEQTVYNFFSYQNNCFYFVLEIDTILINIVSFCKYYDIFVKYNFYKLLKINYLVF